jgi:hypothetical protein
MRCCVVACLSSLVLVLSSGTVSAGFFSGVETFDGKTLDTQTWEPFVSTGAPTRGSISQDDALFLDAFDSGTEVDYTTRQVRIPIGGTARVDVTYLGGQGGGGDLGMFLTNNSRGTSDLTVLDSHWLEIDRRFDGLLFASSGGNGGGNGRPLIVPGTSNTLTKQPAGETFTFEINRLSATTADFNAYGPDHHTALGTWKLTFEEPVTDELAVSLFAHGARGRFDNVGITAVPLPPALATAPLVMAAAAAGMWLHRRRHAPARAG